MRYAISYVSTAQFGLSEQDLNNILNKTKEFNNLQGLTGILLYNEGNFFQLLEGEKASIQDLYEKINKDNRHHDLIKFLEKPVTKYSSDGYLTDFITEDKKYDQSQLNRYFKFIETLDPESAKSIKKVIELMLL